MACLVTAAVMLISSCTSRRAEEKNKDLIPADKLVDILTDFYLTDGLMAIPEVFLQHQDKDTMKVYQEVIGKYGYSLENVTSTVRHYFLTNPKKLKRVYNRVLMNLTEYESLLQAEAAETRPEPENLWLGNTSYALPEEGITNQLYFDFAIPDTGTYTLSLAVVLFADDQSERPRITVWFWKNDGSTAGRTLAWEEKELPKSGTLNYCTLSASTGNEYYTRIRGWLMNHDPKEGRWEKHVRITNVTLLRHDYHNDEQ